VRPPGVIGCWPLRSGPRLLVGQRAWAKEFRPPYAARANPVVDHLSRNTTHALLSQPETALSWLACTA
jgi:hypothetical protein